MSSLRWSIISSQCQSLGAPPFLGLEIRQMKSFKRKAGWQFFSSSHPSSHLSHYLWLLLSSSCCQKIIRPLPHDWSTSKKSPWHIFMEHHYTVPSTIDVCSTASIFHPTIIPPSHAELQGKFCFWPKSTIARFHCQQGFQGGHSKLQKRIRQQETFHIPFYWHCWSFPS